MTERVECDDCGKKVTVRKDDTIAEHHWTSNGVKHRCNASETKYARHAGMFRCVGPVGSRKWLAECRCGETWVTDAHGDETIEEIEGPWREHCEQVKAAQAEAVTTA